MLLTSLFRMTNKCSTILVMQIPLKRSTIVTLKLPVYPCYMFGVRYCEFSQFFKVFESLKYASKYVS